MLVRHAPLDALFRLKPAFLDTHAVTNDPNSNGRTLRRWSGNRLQRKKQSKIQHGYWLIQTSVGLVQLAAKMIVVARMKETACLLLFRSSDMIVRLGSQWGKTAEASPSSVISVAGP